MISRLEARTGEFIVQMALALAAILGCIAAPLCAQRARLPIALSDVPQNQIIRWPSVTLRGDTAWVVANLFPIEGDTLLARPAYLGRVRRTASGDLAVLAPPELPAGDFQFAYPRILSVAGKLHLVWAEFGSRQTMWAGWAPSNPRALWHAAYDRGHWSVPDRIATSYWLGWSDETGGIAAEADGILHVVAWVGDTGTKPRVHDFRLAADGWHDSSLPFTGLNRSAAVATHGDTVIVGLVDSESDSERVAITQSVNHGALWTEPAVAYSRDRAQGPVSRLSIAAVARGRVLAIGTKPNGGFYLDTIRIIRLDAANGRRQVQILDPPAASTTFQFAAGPCGAAVMLIQTFSSSLQLVQAAVPMDSSAIRMRPLLNGAAVAAFAGIVADNHWVVAALAYSRRTGMAGRSVALTLPICSP